MTWLDSFAKIMGRLVPDAITACVVLMLVLALAALGLGTAPSALMDAYYRGLWMLLPFTMQMTLIIVLSSALGSTPFFRAAIRKLARLPRTTNQVVTLAVLITGIAAYMYWGLGIALGPIIAVYFAREAENKGIEIDFLFLLATTWGANSLWQYGFSASAPLLVATPGHFLEKTIGVLPLSTTIWSPAAILHELLFTVAVVAAGCLLMPKVRRPLSHFPNAHKLTEAVAPVEATALSYSERLERRSIFAFMLCAALFAWLINHFFVKKASLDINSLNTTLLFLTILLHGNFKNFTDALQKAVVTSWPVIVLYHLYAGVAGLIQFTTVGEAMAGLVASVSTPLTFPFLSALIGTVFAIFIPSSGGQWAIQGYVTSKAAMEVGVSVQRGILSMSIGDHMGNLTSPFWYVVIGGIAQVDFRSFFGYGLLFAAIWFAIGTVVFTFAPC
jgi:short-chain fatty acids transporter